MREFLNITAFFGMAITISGCLSTQEMPLASNVVRIDTQASGLLFIGQTVPATMRAAARATLDRGYSHFKFADAGVQQGSVVTGAIANSQSNFNGTYGNGYVSGQSYGSGSATFVRTSTAAAGVTVVMFHAGEAGSQGAFDAQQVLKQYSQ